LSENSKGVAASKAATSFFVSREFASNFYAPFPGFLRLYCQVQIDGKDVFVPFNLNVIP
jgi:hypothetical protein